MAMATMAIAGAFPFSASLARLASTSNSSAAHRSMRSSFISASGLSASSNITGMSLGLFLGSNRAMFRTSTRIVQVRAKVSMACTKRSRSRKSVARVSGFRARMATPGGRNVLRRRRAKGRWKLVPATNPNSGKRA